MTLTEPDRTATEGTRPRVVVLTDRCAGCQECVVRCPTGALTMDTRRWIAAADDDLCVGCRQCVRTCPFSAIRVDGPLLVGSRLEPAPVHPDPLLGSDEEVRRGFGTWEEALGAAGRCLECPDPTCVRGCPAHNDIPSFIRAVKARDLETAHAVLRRTSVLPDICSRVCSQAAQCEGSCTWSLAGGEPVAIGKLERFVADRLPVPPPSPRSAGAVGLSVGIVGSGPAGIGAAWELVEAGAAVTVYEKDAQPAGLLGWGIPDFTLPDAIATRPWAQLTAAGVDLRCGSEVAPAELERLLLEHDAVVLAHGSGVPMRLPVPGADLGGVTDATAFLKAGKAALERAGGRASFCADLGLRTEEDDPDRPARVLVLGAGNTAMDVARTARRLGLRAVCVDWLDERFALARPDELAEARLEGVEVLFQRTLKKLEGVEGRVGRALLAKTVQASRERPPKILDGEIEVLRIDLVVLAMGYRADPAFAPALPGAPLRRSAGGLPDRRWQASGILAGAASASAQASPVGRLALGRELGLEAASFAFQDRLWAAGDALVGPSTVVEAMAQGRRAALAVLSAQPRRPGRSPAGLRRVLVAYDSRGGRTARAAGLIAGSLAGAGAQVEVLPLSKVGATELADVDLLVLGCWVEGFVVAGVHPSKTTSAWLAGLPRLGGKAVGIFCTYGVAPKNALVEMRTALEAKGATVVSEAAFGSRALDGGPASSKLASFGRELRDLVAADPRRG
ncbi:MAG TPA: FAD-dependent oxidoreductase [Acidimicrobiales bacterium]|nr:FAD-dependent oxidoreductase [Acidimicrobiales bacterium]